MKIMYIYGFKEKILVINLSIYLENQVTHKQQYLQQSPWCKNNETLFFGQIKECIDRSKAINDIQLINKKSPKIVISSRFLTVEGWGVHYIHISESTYIST